ncbi:MAG: alpha-glucuronidase, partial [Cyclobacteriaceae bacterium]|nr:alpha-glucuronidase [Cyclobacteriaceae bacterium]
MILKYLRTTIFFLFTFAPCAFAEDGYRLWLRYDRIEDQLILKEYKKNVQAVTFERKSPTFQIAEDELVLALNGLLGINPVLSNSIRHTGTILIGTPDSSPLIAG